MTRLAKRKGQLRSLQKDVGDLLQNQEGPERDFSAYEDDPVGFIREVLEEDPWSAQETIADAVLDHDRVAVRSANAVGKDWIAARLALWWTYCREGLALITGPTERQVVEIVMSEVASAWTGADLQGELYQSALKLGRDEQRGILAFTSTEASRLTGFHAPSVLGIITEAQGVPPFAYEGMLACATGEEDRLLAVGNPLKPEGRFYEASRGPGWTELKIPAGDHPNLQEEREVIPGGPSPDFVRRMAEEHGRESGVYRARVLAEFPEDAADAVVPRSLVREAMERTHDTEQDQLYDRYFLGVDVARYGTDRTAFALWRGRRLITVEAHRGLSVTETADLTEQFIREAPVETAFIDAIGMGAGVVDALRGADLGHRVEGVNVGAKAKAADRFDNRKAAHFWALREDLRDGIVTLDAGGEELEQELAAIRYDFTARGKLKIEAKSEAKQRLGRSPDLADAVVLGHAAADQARYGFDEIWVPGEE